jgi:hypothetical protein
MKFTLVDSSLDYKYETMTVDELLKHNGDNKVFRINKKRAEFSARLHIYIEVVAPSPHIKLYSLLAFTLSNVIRN